MHFTLSVIIIIRAPKFPYWCSSKVLQHIDSWRQNVPKILQNILSGSSECEAKIQTYVLQSKQSIHNKAVLIVQTQGRHGQGISTYYQHCTANRPIPDGILPQDHAAHHRCSKQRLAKFVLVALLLIGITCGSPSLCMPVLKALALIVPSYVKVSDLA